MIFDLFIYYRNVEKRCFFLFEKMLIVPIRFACKWVCELYTYVGAKKKHNKKRNNPLKIKWEIKFKAYFIFIHMIYGKINFLHRCTEWICSKLQRIYNIHRQFNDNSTATIIFTETIFFYSIECNSVFVAIEWNEMKKKKKNIVRVITMHALYKL